MFPNRHDIDHPANPLSDEQAMAQVIEPAKQIFKVVDLQDAGGRFDFSSCNDQGDPPYRGVVAISFKLPLEESSGYPREVDMDTYFDHIAATLVAHGWNDGAPAGWHSYGRVVHKDGVIAAMTPSPASGRGAITLDGECRNMTNHRRDGTMMGSDVTDQLRAG